MNSGIYRITRLETGRSYIGSSQNLRKRFYWHRKMLGEGRHHSQFLQRAWAKYGPDAFEFVVIETVERKEDLISREQFWLDKWRDERGVYNSRVIAGSNLGAVWSPESRKKLSLILRGRKHSTERSAIMSAARRGKKRSPLSAETKAKISAANKGKIRTPEICEAMAACRRGKKQSPERAAASAAHLARVWEARRRNAAAEPAGRAEDGKAFQQ